MLVWNGEDTSLVIVTSVENVLMLGGSGELPDLTVNYFNGSIKAVMDPKVEKPNGSTV